MSTTAPPRPPGRHPAGAAESPPGDVRRGAGPSGRRRPAASGSARDRTGGGTADEARASGVRRRPPTPPTGDPRAAPAPVGGGGGATVSPGGGRQVGPGPATARVAEPPGTASAEPRPDLRLVERHRSVRPRLLGTVAVSLVFVALFVLAALQAALVQGQLRLDRLQAGVAEREEARDRLALTVNTLESPERLAEAARGLGMVPAPEVLFLYAPLPGASAPEVLRSGEPSRGGARPAGLDQAESDAAAADTAAAAAAAEAAAAEGGAEDDDAEDGDTAGDEEADADAGDGATGSAHDGVRGGEG